MNKSLIIIIAVLIMGGGFLVWGNQSKQEAMPQLSFAGHYDEIVSSEGIHYHPELTTIINGQNQEIPADIGIGPNYQGNRFYDPMMNMTDIHTHDSSGMLHWEVMEGPTKKGHLRLGNFFEIWGKPFDSSQKIEMFVNGQLNNEFENYLVNDGDKIEIRFE